LFQFSPIPSAGANAAAKVPHPNAPNIAIPLVPNVKDTTTVRIDNNTTASLPYFNSWSELSSLPNTFGISLTIDAEARFIKESAVDITADIIPAYIIPANALGA